MCETEAESRGLSAPALSRVARILPLIVLMMGGASAWFTRHTMNPDGIAYLDLSDRILQRGLTGAVHSYWSPLYPSLLALMRSLVAADSLEEFAVAHLVNFLCFLFGMGTFAYLLRTVEATFAAGNFRAVLRLWGWPLFAWASITEVTLKLATPDLAVMGFVYLAAGLTLTAAARPGWRHFALGICCGVGYLAKAVFFPLSFVFLLASLPRRALLRSTMLGLAGLAITAVPMIATLSREAEKITFGEAGRLNYAFCVRGVPHTHWQGGRSAADGLPLHPTRVISNDPLAFEFAEPVVATYPPWFDPVYWNDGTDGGFDIRLQARRLRQSLRSYVALLLFAQPASTALAVLLLATGAWSLRRLFESWRLVLAPLSGLALYAVVVVEFRYVAPFVVVLFLAILCDLRTPDVPAVVRAVSILVSALLLLTGFHRVFEQAAGLSSNPDERQVAVRLRSLGVQPGARVAIIGSAVSQYWPRLIGARIVAEASGDPSRGFWAAPAHRRAAVLRRFEAAGASLVLSEQEPPLEERSRWLSLEGGTGWVLQIGMRHRPSGALNTG